MNPHFNTYLKKFNHLKVDRSKGQPAPHKPILLLSVLQEMDQGSIRTNQVYITAQLVARFRQNFNQLAPAEKFVANFALPYFHLRSSGFWHLQLKAGMQLQLTSSSSIKSLQQLIDVVAYAHFDEALFTLLQDNECRAILMQALLSTYFDITNGVLVSHDYFGQIEALLLNEPAAVYRKEIASLDEEEVFIRKGAFKKVVPKIYNQTCCVSGLRVISLHDFQMIDACHIVPFAFSHDDTISNGLSLCPNLHRAFDRHLFSIDDDYRVRVSNSFTESQVPYSIRQYDGKQIQLPSEKKYYPALDNLRWHREWKQTGWS